MIYLYDHMQQMRMETINAVFAQMPPERRARAARYQRALDRQCCVLAYWLLCYGLHTEYGITTPPAFVYGERGKPYLREHPAIFFNISHTENGVVCAVSDKAVGVDIQALRPYDRHTAQRVCTDAERARLAASPNPADLFCKLWTLKEAYVKWQAASIARLLTPIDAETALAQAGKDAVCYRGDGYYMSCFGAGEIRTVAQITPLYGADAP